jgi:DNA-binding CsgD family transcriptional regulator
MGTRTTCPRRAFEPGSRMDGRHFDQWTQTVARKLSPGGGGTELEPSALPLHEPVPNPTPEPSPANGTCAFWGTTAAHSGGDGQNATHTMAICGWEHPSALPTSNDGALPGRRSLATRRRAQPLSPRELEIVALITQGLRDREIAAALVLSERTVHAHVRNVLNKLDLTSRTQIAALAATRGQEP